MSSAMDTVELAKVNPAVDARLLVEFELLDRALRELGVPVGPGYQLSPPLGRRPRRGLQPPKPPYERLRFRPSIRR